MAPETASALTDILLCAGTFLLGFTVGKHNGYRTWTALFFFLALAAALGAIYHGVERFHTREFWTLVSTSSCASAFLFLAACLTLSKPKWKWLHWLWPLMTILGLLVGGFLAPFPFWYISAVSGLCILLSIILLPNVPSKAVRNWIYAGIGFTIVGLIAQKATNFSGLLSHNALFHELQLVGNLCFWLGARKS